MISRSFLSPLETARHYSLWKLRKDLVAGLTVAVVEVPQAMAYALIAGVPVQYGLYTSILQGVIGAMLSSSEHVTTGPYSNFLQRLLPCRNQHGSGVVARAKGSRRGCTDLAM